MVTHYLEHQNGKLAYDDAGAGRLVICAPSMGDLRGEYRFLAPQLVAAGCRVVSLDVRGHGESSTTWPDFSVAAIGSDLLALIRALDAGPAVIVGDSMAAGAAVWAAVEAPELISGLALVDPVVRDTAGWTIGLLMRVLFARPWGAAAWARFYTTLYPTRKPADFEAYLAALRANLAQPGRLEALQAMLAAPKTASDERLTRVTVPSLVVMGSRDPDFKDPAAEARRVADAVHGRCELIPTAGHYPHVEMPELAGPIIVSFIQSLL
jgi:pimeloyl-ACP methyl ester carboxylesterase